MFQKGSYPAYSSAYLQVTLGIVLNRTRCFLYDSPNMSLIGCLLFYIVKIQKNV